MSDGVNVVMLYVTENVLSYFFCMLFCHCGFEEFWSELTLLFSWRWCHSFLVRYWKIQFDSWLLVKPSSINYEHLISMKLTMCLLLRLPDSIMHNSHLLSTKKSRSNIFADGKLTRNSHVHVTFTIQLLPRDIVIKVCSM